MKNYLGQTLWLTLSVVVVLLLLNYLPPVTAFGHSLRQVDILGDVRFSPEDDDAAEADSLLIAQPVIKPAFVDTCRAGMTCIEDYSDSTMRGMTHFYETLGKVNALGRPVRIAVFGDSFIEADILTADLREMLQKKYGGCGVGFVDVAIDTYGFRPTVRHSFGGWNSRSQSDTVSYDSGKLGISGRYSIPSRGAYVELRGQDKYASLLDTCNQVSIYFQCKGNLSLSLKINNGAEESYSFTPADSLQKLSVNGRIGSVRWKVSQSSNAVFYGTALDGHKGITVDNFSLRGSSGISIPGIPEKTLKGFNEHRPYDLIILQYGLNVASRMGKDYDYYRKGMLKSIAYLKKCFPQASILVLSIGDRDYKTSSGELRTMPGVKNLIAYQKTIAAESHVAFWNMFEAMGGDGSMAKLVQAKPSEANYDYTHINFRGGKTLAGLLYETLVYGKEQYDRRRNYENE